MQAQGQVLPDRPPPPDWPWWTPVDTHPAPRDTQPALSDTEAAPTPRCASFRKIQAAESSDMHAALLPPMWYTYGHAGAAVSIARGDTNGSAGTVHELHAGINGPECRRGAVPGNTCGARGSGVMIVGIICASVLVLAVCAALAARRWLRAYIRRQNQRNRLVWSVNTDAPHVRSPNSMALTWACIAADGLALEVFFGHGASNCTISEIVMHGMPCSD